MSFERRDKLFDTAEKVLSALFIVGGRYTKKEIKSRLQEVYDTYGISSIAKATSLGDYFELKRAHIFNSKTGKCDEGFEIIAKRFK